ncbi:MAG: succinylglutamate desuccinylase/aspartoacylase family protein, partial [Armatimonadota bacterium]|nr:succinylglutamate desuccinylase/aspartoacylase family protein [Armatimonadota bacterium]
MFPLDARLDYLADSPHLRTITLGHADGDKTLPLRAFAWGDSALPHVYVTAGVHGDEPEGVEAALGLLESLADASLSPLKRHHLVILPCLNPSGLAQGTRTNALGQDINRQFHTDTLPVPAAVRRFVQPAQSAVLIDLHS